MSTKIYDAYEWHGTIQQLMTMLFKLRTKVWQEQKRFITSAAERGHQVHFWKRKRLSLDFHLREPNHSEDYEQHTMELREVIKRGWLAEYLRAEMRAGFNSMFNFTSSSCVYFYRDRIFVQFFGVDFNRTTLKKDRRLKDFHYQNQTDQPERISDAEWKERERIWDSIFKEERHTPAQAGLVFPIFEESQAFYFSYELMRDMFKSEP